MEQPRTLGEPSARFAGDDGTPDPVTRSIIAGVRDQHSYIRALVALCTTRFLMPIVATGDETPHADPDRHAEMAAVTLTEDDVTYLLAFTGIDSLQSWNSSARPVLCLLNELATSVGQAGATALLIDCAGPAPLVVTGEALVQFADGFSLVEFEGGEFSWVKYGPEQDPAQQLRDQIDGLQTRLDELRDETEAGEF